MAERLAKRVLLIGWDAADWKLINPLMDAGLMPALNGLVNRGVMAGLTSLRPLYSPLIWNSIATGKLPDKHGVLGFMEPDPVTGGVRASTSTTRKVKAIWNILTQQGLRAHVVCWFAGHPAEPINGVCVSPVYPHMAGRLDKPWPLPEGAIHPPELRETFESLRVHAEELTQAELQPFIPRAAEIDQEKDRRLFVLARLLAECCTVHNAATWILENQEWDFVAVFYDAIDHFCHAFARYLPPRMEKVPEKDFEIYKDVVNGVYRFHDMMLGRLLKLAGPDTAVVLLSDHGFHSDHLRPTRPMPGPAAPAAWHRPMGILTLAGPHLRGDERIYGAGVLDITPTILTLLGLPVAADMDGKVLVEAFDSPPHTEVIPSWEEAPGECGMHPPDMRIDPASTRAMIEQFVALGYVEAPSGEKSKALAQVEHETRFNLAAVYLNSGRPRLALPILEELATQEIFRARSVVALAQCHLALGQPEEAKRVLAPLLEDDKQRSWAEWLMGAAELRDIRPEEAMEHLATAEQAAAAGPGLLLRIGYSYARLRRWEDAERAFGKAIERDPESARAHLGMAMVHMRRRRFEDAVQHALEAVAAEYYFPAAHFTLGIALVHLRQFDRAVVALERALAIAPGMIAAHRWLAAIHRRPGGDAEKAALHRQRARDLRRQARC